VMKVIIAGSYQTRFGELWERSLLSLLMEAGQGAMKDAGVQASEIDLVVVGNKLGGRISEQDHLGALMADKLRVKGRGIRVEAACASGGIAVHQAVQAIKTGEAETVLVLGGEKMTDKNNGVVGAALMGAASEEERRTGLSFVGLYALMARAYMEKFGARRRDLAKVAVKNHKQASLNPKAQFPREITEEMALKAIMVAEPLGLFDCSPISDGAAGLVVRGVKTKKAGKREVEILASEIATDSLGLNERESLLEIKATKEAAGRAYVSAGVGPEEIDIMEVHDCFTIAEILALEDLGFCKKGEGFKGIDKPVNLSGGLKACGHPVGATGVKQMVELTHHLRREAGERQADKADMGLAHNVGGTGGTAVVHILKGSI